MGHCRRKGGSIHLEGVRDFLSVARFVVALCDVIEYLIDQFFEVLIATHVS